MGGREEGVELTEGGESSFYLGHIGIFVYGWLKQVCMTCRDTDRADQQRDRATICVSLASTRSSTRFGSRVELVSASALMDCFSSFLVIQGARRPPLARADLCTVLRNLIRVFRPIVKPLLPLDENIWFHRQIAYSLLFWTIVHTTAHCELLFLSRAPRS